VFSRNLKQPFGIAVFEDTLYWADQGHSSIMSVDKVTGTAIPNGCFKFLENTI
jgi:hypothetical protein